MTISIVYSWETKKQLDGLNFEEGQMDDPAEEELNGEHQADTVERASVDSQQTDISEEEPADQQQDDVEEVENQKEIDSGEKKQGSNPQDETGKEPSDTLHTDVNQENTNGAEPDTVISNTDIQQDASANVNAEDKKEPVSDYSMKPEQEGGSEEEITSGLKTDEGKAGSEEKEKEEIKHIDLQEPQKVDVNIDSWKIDEKGRIVSQQYLLYNAGDTAGIWTLSELICKPQEQNRVRVTADKKALHDSEGKAVYMELVLGNGEKVILSQENCMYEVKLKAGENLAVRFIGEMNGNLFESREEGDIAVTAVCSWCRD